MKNLRKKFARIAQLTLAAGAVYASVGFDCRSPGAPLWPFWGGNLQNTHFAASETKISVSNVASLQVKWVFAAHGDVSAVPTVAEHELYVTDWGQPLLPGWIHAIDRDTGASILSRPISDFSQNAIDDVSRSSPAIDGDLLIFGDVRNQLTAAVGLLPGASGATLYAVSRSTGQLVWKTNLSPHPLAVVTQSPVVYKGRVYVGVSSLEETAAKLVYPCCSFRGSMAALDEATGRILWQTYTTPVGFSGASVWGSSPSIDEARNAVYVGTGNNYSTPPDLAACLAAHRGDPAAQQTCFDTLDAPDNFADSVLAFDLDTGAFKWARKLQNYGAWNFACDPALAPGIPTNTANCYDLDSLDFDFGQAPMIIKRPGKADLLAAGQKSGVYWTFDPDQAGRTVWTTAVGPGGVLGGMEWGSSTDGTRIYTQITNFDHIPFQLVAGPQAGITVNGGVWAALDVDTGKILWQTPDPSSFRPLKGTYFNAAWGSGLGDGFFGTALGPSTIANGVLFTGSMDREGHMYALDAATGAILWTFASGASVASAPAVVDGVVYWGSGYHTGFENTKLYAFALP
jgi:polyvinyl alcohol dehydrogenase (cytochrome)